MIDMIRTVHPVGQGAFISEKFIKKNGSETIFIYDCGTQNGKSVIEKEIRNCFQEETEIEAVYISHPDNDHANGLDFLIRYCNVKNVYLPYLSPQAAVIAMIKYKCQEESGDGDLCSEFVSELIFYSFYNDFSEEEQKFPDIHIVNINLPNIRSIKAENIAVWKYIAFNNENKQIKQKFSDLLEAEGISSDLLSNMNSFTHLWNNTSQRNILKRAYKKLDGGINANSLGLVSYPESESCKIYTVYSYIKNHRTFSESKTGAVYTGDMDLSEKSKILSKKIHKAEHTGLLQLPHHGSKNNYCSECIKYFDIFIANAGYKNPYGHPSGFVIDDLIKNDKQLYTVTEQSGSRYIEYIKIY